MKCIPDEGEPSFTLLGRDPQAPALVTTWAQDRAKYEPTATLKIIGAYAIAREMIIYKLQNPSKGLVLISDPSQVVREEWHRAVKEFSLRPGSAAEVITARIIQRLAGIEPR